MSYEPTIYAKENNVLYRKLRLSLENKSWESVFWSESTSSVPDDTGVISNGLVYAWKRDYISEELITTLLKKNNDSEIQNMLNDGVLATCEIFIDENYSINDEYEDDEIEELVEDMGENYVAQLRQAKCTITSRSNNGCGPLTDEFHEIFLDILIKMTNGFYEEE